MSTYAAAQDRAIALAHSHNGVHEEGGHNRGSLIDLWNQRVGNPLGSPWCVAFGWCMMDDACREMGLRNPLPRCGSVAKMVARSPSIVMSPTPARGFGCHFEDPKQPWGLGHFVLVDSVAVGAPGWLNTVEGNTNRDGGREGDSVWAKKRGLDFVSVYIDLSKLEAAPAGTPAVA